MTNQATSPMELRTHPVGDWKMNAYALICPHTYESVLIDPGNEPEEMLDHVGHFLDSPLLIITGDVF